MKYLFNLCRKFLLLLVSELLGSWLGITLIGLVNRHLMGGKLQTLFVCYSVNKEYKNAMIFDWYEPRIKWRPAIAGVFIHKLGGGLTFGISANEEELTDPKNLDNLIAFDQRMQYLAKRIGAKNVAYAGILPSVMKKCQIRNTFPESEATVNLIMRSLDQLEVSENLPKDFPIIVIGSNGHIGSMVVKRIKDQFAHRLVEVDQQHLSQERHFPEPLRLHYGKAAVAINVSRNKVLDSYLEFMWPGLVILNDVFPEAERGTIKAISDIGAKYYHLAGIKGVAFPKFPKSYSGSIPCCTALTKIKDSKKAFEVMLLSR